MYQETRNEVQYKEYTIKPRHQPSWPESDRFGYWISKDGCNAAPGAAWFRDVGEARKAIDRLELAKGNADLWWLLGGGGGGLSIHSIIGGKERTIKSAAFRDTTIVQREGEIELILPGLVTGVLTPAKALALAAMLREAAELALGRKY